MHKYIESTKILFSGSATGIDNKYYNAFIVKHEPAERYQIQLQNMIYPTRDSIDANLMLQLSHFRENIKDDDKQMLSALIVMSAARPRVKWIDDYYRKIESTKITPESKDIITPSKSKDIITPTNIKTAPVPIIFYPSPESFEKLPYKNLGVTFTPLDSESAKIRNVIIYAFNHTGSRFEWAVGEDKLAQYKKDYSNHKIVILEFGIAASSAMQNPQEKTEFKEIPVIKVWYNAAFALLDIPENTAAKEELIKIVNT